MYKLLASALVVLGVAGLACSSREPTGAVPTDHDGATIRELTLACDFMPHYGTVMASRIFADLHLRQGETYDTAAVREGIRTLWTREHLRVDSIVAESLAAGGVRVVVTISEA